jgi:hypothetical protein
MTKTAGIVGLVFIAKLMLTNCHNRHTKSKIAPAVDEELEEVSAGVMGGVWPR